MKRLLLLMVLAFPLLAGAQNIRIQQLRSGSEAAGRIIQADGNGSFEFADLAASGAIDSMRISGNILEVYAGGSLTPYTADLSPYLDNTDAQVFDVATLAGTVLQLSISGDGEATKTIDLSSLVGATETQLADTAAQLRSEIPDISGLATETQLGDTAAVLRAEIAASAGGVSSVNTQTGDVVLDQDDIGDGVTYVRTTNDYTTTEKTKLSGIEAGAQVNTVNSVNGYTGAVVVNPDDMDDVDYDNVAATLKGAATDNDGAWDFSSAGIITASISSNTTVTFSNLQLNKQLKIHLTLSSSATITWPAYCQVIGAELGDGTFKIYADCWNATASSEDVLINIIAE